MNNSNPDISLDGNSQKILQSHPFSFLIFSYDFIVYAYFTYDFTKLVTYRIFNTNL